MASTTIQLKSETREKLKALSSKGETYDEIIQELMDAYDAFIDELYTVHEEGEFIPWEEALREIEATHREKGPKKAGKTLSTAAKRL